MSGDFSVLPQIIPHATVCEIHLSSVVVRNAYPVVI